MERATVGKEECGMRRGRKREDSNGRGRRGVKEVREVNETSRVWKRWRRKGRNTIGEGNGKHGTGKLRDGMRLEG